MIGRSLSHALALAVAAAIASAPAPSATQDVRRSRHEWLSANVLNDVALARHVASMASNVPGDLLVMCAVKPAATSQVVEILRSHGVPDLFWNGTIGYVRGRFTSVTLAHLEHPAIESCQIDSVAEFRRLQREVSTSTSEPSSSRAGATAVTAVRDEPGSFESRATLPSPRYSTHNQLRLSGATRPAHRDGRGVTIGIVEATTVQLTHPVLRQALARDGRPARKIRRLIVPDPVRRADRSITLPPGRLARATRAIWGRDYLLEVDRDHARLRIDVNRNGDLQDDPILYDYNSDRWSRRSVARMSQNGEPVDVVITFDDARNLVLLHPFTSEHALLVSSVAAGRDPDGRVQGAAPAASLVLVATGLTTVSRFEGILAAASDPDVDVVSCSFMLDPGPGSGEPTTAARLIDRTILAYNKLVFFAATNTGTGFLSRRGIGRYAIVVGAYATQEAATHFLDVPAPADGLVMSYTPWGSAEGDGLYPDVLAPAMAPGASPCRVDDANDRDGRSVPRPDCVTLASGTSSATPAAAGTAAVVLGVARQKNIRLSALELRRLLLTTAKRVSTARAIAQGHGVIDPLAAIAGVTGRSVATATATATTMAATTKTTATGTGTATIEAAFETSSDDSTGAAGFLVMAPGTMRTGRLRTRGVHPAKIQVAGDPGIVRIAGDASSAEGASITIHPTQAGVYAAQVYVVDPRTGSRLAWQPIRVLSVPSAVRSDHEMTASLTLHPLERHDYVTSSARGARHLRYCVDVTSGALLRGVSVDTGYPIEDSSADGPATWEMVGAGTRFCHTRLIPPSRMTLVSMSAGGVERLPPPRQLTTASLRIGMLGGTLDLEGPGVGSSALGDGLAVRARVRSTAGILESPELTVWKARRTVWRSRDTAVAGTWTPGVIQQQPADAATLVRLRGAARGDRLLMFACSSTACKLISDPLQESTEVLVRTQGPAATQFVPVVISSSRASVVEVEQLGIPAQPLVRRSGPVVSPESPWEASIPLAGLAPSEPDQALLLMLSDRTSASSRRTSIATDDETLARQVVEWPGLQRLARGVRDR